MDDWIQIYPTSETENINSLGYINSLWTKWIIERIYYVIHTLTLIRLAHHRWNENVIDGIT